MYIKERYEYDNFPTWALCALFNGDYSSLSDDDEKLLDQWLEVHNDVVTWDVKEHSLDNPHFLIYPAFGLATDCVKIKGYVYGGRTR